MDLEENLTVSSFDNAQHFSERVKCAGVLRGWHRVRETCRAGCRLKVRFEDRRWAAISPAAAELAGWSNAEPAPVLLIQKSCEHART